MHDDFIISSSFQFFSFTGCDRTRGHNLRLYIQNCLLDVRKFSFARRVCPVWNTLSHYAVNAFSNSFFKAQTRCSQFRYVYILFFLCPGTRQCFVLNLCVQLAVVCPTNCSLIHFQPSYIGVLY